MNRGLMADVFIDCIAEIPCGVGRAARPFITKLEKAKKTPPITPVQSAANSARFEIDCSRNGIVTAISLDGNRESDAVFWE
jgi:hypothetical protein